MATQISFAARPEGHSRRYGEVGDDRFDLPVVQHPHHLAVARRRIAGRARAFQYLEQSVHGSEGACDHGAEARLRIDDVMTLVVLLEPRRETRGREILIKRGRPRCRLLFSEDLKHGQKFGTLTAANPFHREGD